MKSKTAVFSLTLVLCFPALSCRLIKEKRLQSKYNSLCSNREPPGHVELELKLVDDRGGGAFFSEAAGKLEEGSRVRLVEYALLDKEKTKVLEAVDERSGMSGRKALEEFLRTVDVPEGHSVVLHKEISDEGPGLWKWHALYLEEPAVITEEHVEKAEILEDAELGWMHPVLMELNKEGARLFESFTAKHVNERTAILVNGEIISAPVLREKITGGRIQVVMDVGETSEASFCRAMDLVRALTEGR